MGAGDDNHREKISLRSASITSQDCKHSDTTSVGRHSGKARKVRDKRRRIMRTQSAGEQSARGSRVCTGAESGRVSARRSDRPTMRKLIFFFFCEVRNARLPTLPGFSHVDYMHSISNSTYKFFQTANQKHDKCKSYSWARFGRTSKIVRLIFYACTLIFVVVYATSRNSNF